MNNVRAAILAAFSIGSSLCSMVVRAEIALEAEQRENLGIKAEAVRTVEATRTWRAAAQVLDASPLIASLSELQTAEHAAAASRAEAERSERLYRDETNVARKAVEAARAQAIADRGKVATSRALLMAGWGRSIAALNAEARTRLVDELLNGHTSLIRAEHLSALPADTQITDATVRELAGKGSWPAQSLGALPPGSGAAGGGGSAGGSSASGGGGASSGASTLFGASLLKVEAPLAPGQLLSATLAQSGAPLRGIQVTSTAIIRWHGSEWVYEETSPNHFTRRAVRTGARLEGGTLVEGDIKAGQNVVTVGARALLGAEQGASEPQDAEDADD